MNRNTVTRVLKGVLLLLVSSLFLHGCAHSRASSEIVVLDGYSEGNYAELDEHIGTGKRVCVRGNLRVGAADGVYFQLQPVEKDGVLDPGFSRVTTDISRSVLDRHGLEIGSTSEQTICGVVRDSTPFPKCDFNDCRWYEIRGSVLGR